MENKAKYQSPKLNLVDPESAVSPVYYVPDTDNSEIRSRNLPCIFLHKQYIPRKHSRRMKIVESNSFDFLTHIRKSNYQVQDWVRLCMPWDFHLWKHPKKYFFIHQKKYRIGLSTQNLRYNSKLGSDNLRILEYNRYGMDSSRHTSWKFYHSSWDNRLLCWIRKYQRIFHSLCHNT